ncbi:MAG TPA: c-type cytochrome [Bacteroidia bacterium]|nr:c-type cytochrome [Bacteroidia bacterium]
MKNQLFIISALVLFTVACQQAQTSTEVIKPTHELLGYASQDAWGEHLVSTMGCDDCHSPKVMTDHGPVPDMSRRLSGYPADEKMPQVDRALIEQQGLGTCNSGLTGWIGPWGISYAGNITPDPTGIGNWSEEQFSKAIREGKFKGLDGGRMLLPPMPWFNYKNLTDDEVKAMFAYLKTITPIQNVVPAPEPPLAAIQ